MRRFSTGRIVRWGVVLALVGGFVYLRCRPARDYQLEWAREEKTAAALVRYVDRGGDPRRVKGELKRHHAATHTKLTAAGVAPEAPIHALLDALLAAVENRVMIEVADVTVDRDSFAAAASLLAGGDVHVAPVGDGLYRPAYACARGVNAVFAAELGGDAVVETDGTFVDGADRGRPVLAVDWKVRAGARAYARANGKRLFPSIVVDAGLTLRVGDRTLVETRVTAQPAGDIQYTTYGMMPALDLMYPDSDSSDGDVYGGIVASTCEALGRQLYARLTGLAAAPAEATDELAHLQKWCDEKGDVRSCMTLGVRFRDGDGVPADPARAEELLYRACRDGLGAGAEACAPAAAMTFARGVDMAATGDDRARATLALMDGCHHNQAASCSALAQVQATPFPGEDAPSAYGAHQAGLSWLHACDLGDAGACAAAVSVLAPHRPLHAVLLARRACAAGVTAACTPDRALTSRAARTRTLFDVTLAPGDEPFDIRFATLFDGDETELIWIASHDPPTTVERRLAPSIARGTVRVEPPDTLASAPTWARSIYFVGAPPTSPYAEPCRPCPHPPSAFSITRCICLP